MISAAVVQAGAASGHLAIDGETIAIDPQSWRAGRDRSWGVRPETKGRFNWVCAQLPSFHLWYLAVEDATGAQRFAEGWIRNAHARGGNGLERVERIAPRPVWAEDGAFRAAEVEIESGDGRTRAIEFRRLGSTAFMRGGLYGGWRAARRASAEVCCASRASAGTSAMARRSQRSPGSTITFARSRAAERPASASSS